MYSVVQIFYEFVREVETNVTRAVQRLKDSMVVSVALSVMQSVLAILFLCSTWGGQKLFQGIFFCGRSRRVEILITIKIWTLSSKKHRHEIWQVALHQRLLTDIGLCSTYMGLSFWSEGFVLPFLSVNDVAAAWVSKLPYQMTASSISERRILWRQVPRPARSRRSSSSSHRWESSDISRIQP
jgi:hypothetical protein